MADLESSLYTVLTADATLTSLVGSRIYPEVAPADAAPPYLVYQRISTVRPRHLKGAAYLPRVRLQIDVCGVSKSSVRAVAERLRSLLDNYFGTFGGIKVKGCELDDQRSDQFYDNDGRDVGTYLESMDFLITHDESV